MHKRVYVSVIQMYYSLSTASSNAAILTQPVPSISMEGVVPTKPTGTSHCTRQLC